MDHDARIDRFFTTYGTVAEGARAVHAQLSRRLAVDLNLLDHMRTDEHGLSALIAMLLDPRGAHGQGDAFLRAFVDECGFVGLDGLDRARVTREVRTPQGNLDILVHVPGGLDLVIENKPYAAEGHRQLDRYARWLEGRAGPGHLVFVPGGQDAPATLAAEPRRRLEARGGYATLRYDGGGGRGLDRWLDACARLAEPDKVRHLARDFAEWCRRTFPSADWDEGDVA
ncbi:MAG: PD-(D/E)XK nuclease family protein [Paracoccaceae bacterium]